MFVRSGTRTRDSLVVSCDTNHWATVKSLKQIILLTKYNVAIFLLIPSKYKKHIQV